MSTYPFQMTLNIIIFNINFKCITPKRILALYPWIFLTHRSYSFFLWFTQYSHPNQEQALYAIHLKLIPNSTPCHLSTAFTLFQSTLIRWWQCHWYKQFFHLQYSTWSNTVQSSQDRVAILNSKHSYHPHAQNSPVTLPIDTEPAYSKCLGKLVFVFETSPYTPLHIPTCLANFYSSSSLDINVIFTASCPMLQ